MNLDTLGLWLGWALTAAFGALVAAELIRYFKTAFAPSAGRVEAPERPRTPWPRLIAWTLVAFVASRLLVAGCCAAWYAHENHTLSGFWPVFAGKLRPWDADHYLDIIEHGYSAEGESRLFIVFLPFYPMLCRALRWLTGLSPFATALAVSNLALVGGGLALFRLVEAEDGPAVAGRAMLLMMFNPMTYFYSLPYTESMFLLTTLLAALFARRRRWVWAVLFGAMAANTRIVGMATAIPIFWEMLRAGTDAAAARGESEDGAARLRRAGLCALKVLPVGAGLLLYLNANLRLFGNATQFMIFQKENWYQSFGTMANTFQYCLHNTLDYGDFLYRLGVWGPQLALLLAVPAAVFWRRGREPAGDTAYLLAAHYVNFAPTWLLSGPRYLSALYPVYPLLARIPKGRKGFVALFAVQCLLLGYMAIVGYWFVKVY